MGIKFATNLITTNLIDYINLSEEYSIAEIEPLNDWYGHTIFKLDIRAKFVLNVIGIKRKNKLIILPNINEFILPEDILIVIGLNSDIENANAKSKNGDA